MFLVKVHRMVRPEKFRVKLDTKGMWDARVLWACKNLDPPRYTNLGKVSHVYQTTGDPRCSLHCHPNPHTLGIDSERFLQSSSAVQLGLSFFAPLYLRLDLTQSLVCAHKLVVTTTLFS
jgi:hypothetical protein